MKTPTRKPATPKTAPRAELVDARGSVVASTTFLGKAWDCEDGDLRDRLNRLHRPSDYGYLDPKTPILVAASDTGLSARFLDWPPDEPIDPNVAY